MASSNIARLGIVLGIDTAAFQADVDKAIQANKTLKNAIQRDSDAAAKEILSLKYATEDYGKEVSKVALIEREIAAGRYQNASPLIVQELKQRAAAYDAIATSSKKASNGMNAQQQMQLTYQTTDFFTQIASGQSAMIAAIQQGGQLKDSMGGLGPMFSMLTGLVTPFVAVVGALTVALGAVGYAIYSSRKELDGLKDSIALTGGYTKDVGERFFITSRILSQNLNVSVGDAKNVMMALIESGKFTGATFDNVSQTILTFAKVSGTDATQAAQKLIPSLDGTASSSKRLNDQYHFLTLEQYKNIEALEKQGKTQQAIIIQSTALEQSLQSQQRELSNLEKAWAGVRNTASQAWDSMQSKFRAPTVIEELSVISKKIYDLQKAANGDNGYGRLKALEDMPQYVARYEKLAHDYLMTLAEVRAKEKEGNNIDEEAKNRQKRRSLKDANDKQDFENKMAWEIRGATAMEKINLDAYRQIEEARMEMANKNREEANNFKVENQKALDAKILSIAIATTDKIKAYEDKAFIDKQTAEEEYIKGQIDALDNAAKAYGKIYDAIYENTVAEEHSLVVEKDKLLLKYTTIGMSEKEVALREEMLSLQEKLYQLEQRKDLKQGDKEIFADRYKAMNNEKQHLIEMTDHFKTLDSMAKSVYSNMSDYIDQFVKTGKFSFEDFVRSTIQGLVAIQMKAQMTSLTGGSSGIGDILKGLFGGFGSGAKPSGAVSLETFASGGSIDANQLSIIGEQGPELFMPSGAGTIIPNNLLGGGGGQTINYNGPYIASMSAIDTQTGVQFLAKNKQTIWASYQSANRSVPVSR